MPGFEESEMESDSGARFVFFNLSEKKYREGALSSFLELSADHQYSDEMLVLTSNVNLEDFSKILDCFKLNPILLHEVSNRQTYDKCVEMDEKTILYNLQIHKQYQLKNNSLLKILHMKNHHILLILTDAKEHNENSDLPQETGFEVIFKKLTTFFEFACKSPSQQQSEAILNEKDDISHSQESSES